MFSIDPKIGEWQENLVLKYGKIFYLRLGAHSMIMVGSFEGAMEVLKTKDLIFADRTINGLMKAPAQSVGFDS
jgi:hypothetical protein